MPRQSWATVYVELLNEGTPCWRPVLAEHLGEGRFKLIGTPTSDEAWRFRAPDVVRCRVETLIDGGRPHQCLVAYESATDGGFESTPLT
jgi:hypothetical protein